MLPVRTGEQAAEEQADREQRATSESWTQILAGLTLLLGIGQLWMIGKQVSIASKQNTIIENQTAVMDAQRAAADAQAVTMTDQLVQMREQSTLMGLNLQAFERNAIDQGTQTREAITVSARTADAARTSATVAVESLATNVEIERAYVKMAHAPKPCDNPNGGRFDFVTPTGGTHTEVWFKYSVKNYGRTSCNVLGGGLWSVIDSQNQRPPIAPVPERTPIHVDPTFLVPGMATSDKTVLFLDTATVNRVREGAEHLWLLSYVDYEDRFGGFHRAGYGRHYDHNAMDLVFDRTTAPFNYDRPLSREERQQYENQGP